MRKPIVSRTLKVTLARCMVVNLRTAETYEHEAHIPRLYKSKEKLEQACRKVIDSDKVKLCYVIEAREQRQLYAMTEAEFLKYAQPIEDRSAEGTRKLHNTKLETA